MTTFKNNLDYSKLLFDNVLNDLKKSFIYYKIYSKQTIDQCAECDKHGLQVEEPCYKIYSDIMAIEFSDIKYYVFYRVSHCINSIFYHT